ncbi:MAG TPA: hypothetical protein VJS92_04090 [Candidatus Polarisedimenticolaceae bacterium]|nr:hypothetical protein [Candidatus Polarisedimenticolaceae bacterium]
MRPLGDVLIRTAECIEVEPDATYETAGVLSFGRGLFRREPVLGLNTSYRTYVPIRTGQLVYSRLFAWEGAIAVVDATHDSLLVSPEFPVFDLASDLADAGYLKLLCRWPALWEALQQETKGMGLRRQRVHPEQFLSLNVPLPDLDEQRRVAARLSSLLLKVDRHRDLSRTAHERANALPVALAHRPDLGDAEKRSRGWRLTRLSEVLHQSAERISVDASQSYPNFGILNFGRGVFIKAPIEGSATSARELFRVSAGQFIYSRLFAFEGAFALVPTDFDGYYVSNEFPAFDCDQRRVTAGFLASYFRAKQVWAELSASSVGLGLRRQRVSPQRILALEIWLPPMHDQEVVVKALAASNRVSALSGRNLTRSKSLVTSLLNRAFAGEL